MTLTTPDIQTDSSTSEGRGELCFLTTGALVSHKWTFLMVVATTETFYAHLLNSLTNCYIFYVHNVGTFSQLRSISVTDIASFRGS